MKNNFGKRLKQLREKRGWTQVDLAEHTDLGRSYLSDLEKGRKPVCLPTLQILAGALGMSVSGMLRGL